MYKVCIRREQGKGKGKGNGKGKEKEKGKAKRNRRSIRKKKTLLFCYGALMLFFC